MKNSITVLVFNTTIIRINSLMEIQKGCANLPILSIKMYKYKKSMSSINLISLSLSN